MISKVELFWKCKILGGSFWNWGYQWFSKDFFGRIFGRTKGYRVDNGKSYRSNAFEGSTQISVGFDMPNIIIFIIVKTIRRH